MKLRKLALVATIACGTYAGNVFADQANDISLVSHCAAPACDCGEPVCGCEPCCEEEAACCDNNCCESDCCDSCCDSCGSGGCMLGDMLGGFSMGDLGSCMPGCGQCCLGDPYRICDDDIYGWSLGGWFQMGYHTRANSLFNSYPDNFQLQQGWLYAEKEIDTRCGFDCGGRIDIMYGTDSQDTQAFGTGQRGWDNGWDNGANYGGALPQMYVEAGYGDLSMIMGKFYTILGYEVVQAPDNFFYSHAYTFYNSEPFTHTGFLSKYEPSDALTFWSGYSFGRDSGFDDNGDAFLGGIALGLTDDLRLTYATTFGRLVEPWSGVTAPVNLAITGYHHSIVAEYNITPCCKYVFQNDVLSSDFADGTNALDTVGINQYLIRKINDCWGVGTRFEWWNAKFGPAASSDDVFAWTVGANYRPHANVVVRPEIRADWNSDRNPLARLQNNAASQTTFGVDTILTF